MLFGNELRGVTDEAISLENLVKGSGIYYIFGIAFIALTVILSMSGTKGKQGYTLRRLRITEKETFVCQLIFNSLTYAMLIMAELITLMIISGMYFKFSSACELYSEDFVTHQTLFLSFYRNDFMHSILPLDDIPRHIRNVFYILGMGITSAAFPYLMRRKKICFEMPVLAVIIIFTFNDSFEAYSEIALSVWTVLFAVWATVRCMREDVAYEK